MLIKRIVTFLILIPAICSRTYCMDTLLQKTRETAIPLAKAVLETTIQNHTKSLVKKDFSQSSTENIGDINYCACCLIDNRNFDIYNLSGLPQILKRPAHTTITNKINVFISGKPKSGYLAIEKGITEAFSEYYSIVFGHPLTKLFPTSEFHIRKADSEQKMLYALEDRNIFSALKTKDTDRSMLAYTGKTLVVYTLRNTCPFCNVALGGFLAKQIREYVSGRDSLGIRNIHVFYSFDDQGSDKSVRKETERLQESMLLIQPNITYTQMPIEITIRLMLDSICFSYGTAKQYLELIQRIYFTSSDEVQKMVLDNIMRFNSGASPDSVLFSDQILNTFIQNIDPKVLDFNFIESYLPIIAKLPESEFRNAVINTYSILDKVLHLESSSDIDEKLGLSKEINLTVLPDFIDIIKTKIGNIISNLDKESPNEKRNTLIMKLRSIIQ